MSRDDQFLGWASAVLSKMFEATKEHTHGDSLDLGSEEAQQAMFQVVARAGYDLVMHTVETLDYGILRRWLSGESFPLFDALFESVPDLAELPEENNTSRLTRKQVCRF